MPYTKEQYKSTLDQVRASPKWVDATDQQKMSVLTDVSNQMGFPLGGVPGGTFLRSQSAPALSSVEVEKQERAAIKPPSGSRMSLLERTARGLGGGLIAPYLAGRQKAAAEKVEFQDMIEYAEATGREKPARPLLPGDKFSKLSPYDRETRKLFEKEFMEPQQEAMKAYQKILYDSGALEDQVDMFGVPAAKTTAEKAADIVGGLSAFILKVAAARRMLPKGWLVKHPHLGEALAWEASNLGTGVPVGHGALMSRTLGLISSIKTGSFWGEAGKMGMTSSGFAALTAITGGKMDDIILNALIPPALSGLRGFPEFKSRAKQKMANARSLEEHLDAVTEINAEIKVLSGAADVTAKLMERKGAPEPAELKPAAKAEELPPKEDAVRQSERLELQRISDKVMEGEPLTKEEQAYTERMKLKHGDPTASPIGQDAPATNPQKAEAHKIARRLKLTDEARRDIAEETTGKRSMVDMTAGQAGEFISALRRMEGKGGEKSAREIREDKAVTPRQRLELERGKEVSGKDIQRSEEVKPATSESKLSQERKAADKEEVVGRLERAEEAEKAAEPPFLSKEAKEFSDIFDENTSTAASLRKMTPAKLKSLVRDAVWDTTGDVKAAMRKLGYEGDKAITQIILGKGSQPRSDNFLRRALKIFRGASAKWMKLIAKTIIARRAETIWRYKPGYKRDITPEQARAHIEHIESLPEGKSIMSTVNKFFGQMRLPLDRMLKHEIITQKQYDDLVAKGDYSPLAMIEAIEPIYKEGKSVVGSGLPPLKDAMLKTAESDPRVLLDIVLSRTEARIGKNDILRSLANVAREIPDNLFVMLPKERFRIKQKRSKGESLTKEEQARIEQVTERVEYREKGKAAELLVNRDIANDLLTKGPEMSTQLTTAISWLTLTRPLKFFATGVNIEFAVTNVPRDVALIMIASKEYSSTIPIALGQITADMAVVAKDAALRQGKYYDALAEAGGLIGNTLTMQGIAPGRSLARKGMAKLGVVVDVLAWTGQTSELITRLALYRRTLQNRVEKGVPYEQAVLEAAAESRNYLDFSQGGWLIKALDAGVPYIGPAIQATRGFWRAAKTDFPRFIYQMAQIIGMDALMKLAFAKSMEENKGDVSDAMKLNYFTIALPKGMFYIDADGNKRQMYATIARDQSQRWAGVLGGLAAAAISGKEPSVYGVSVKNARAAIKEFLPFFPDTDVIPPTIKALGGYWANWDYWRGEPIWKGAPVSDVTLEFDASVHPFIKAMAQKMGLSPIRIEYALNQVFTVNNMYAQIANMLTGTAFEKLDDANREMVMKEMLTKFPAARRLFRSASPDWMVGERERLRETELQENTESLIQRRNIKELVEKMKEDPEGRNLELQRELIDFIDAVPVFDKERVIEAYSKELWREGIPNTWWWASIAGLKAPGRAEAFYRRYKDSSPEMQQKMMDWSLQAIGIRGEQFSILLSEMMMTADTDTGQREVPSTALTGY